MTFLLRVVSVAVSIVLLPFAAKAETEQLPTTSNLPPRKVIVGTSMEAFWVDYPGLQQRLEQLGKSISTSLCCLKWQSMVKRVKTPSDTRSFWKEW